MKNQIALLLPYFGAFPSYFQLWLDSAGFNKDSIDYILITDQSMDKYRVPSNIIVVKKSFEELKKIISRQYDFNISLDKPYKLCDYKPAYGEIFKELLYGYKYWGFCDPDVIWGNLAFFLKKYNFFKKDYDKFGCLGHFQILKNNKKVTSIYRYYDNEKMRDYRYVFSHPYSFLFDEQFSFDVIAREQDLTINDLMYNPTPFADIKPIPLNFQRAYGEFTNIKYRYFMFDRYKGLREIIVKNDLSQESYPCMYVHLQKRKMKVYTNNTEDSKIILPNKIVDNDAFVRKSNMVQSGIYDLGKWLNFHVKKQSLDSIKHKIELKQFLLKQK